MAALRQVIVDETKALAAAYRLLFAGDTRAELQAWLEIAVRREALVREVYGAVQRERRLPSPRFSAERVAWDALTEIWQEENVHTELVRARLVDGFMRQQHAEVRTKVAEVLGAAEGKVLSALTEEHPSLRQLVAGLAVALGGGLVPAPARALEPLGPREFFGLAQALELTARLSYQRMEELAAELVVQLQPSVQLAGLRRELRRTRLDEEFHERAFGLMATWTDESGHFVAELDEMACVQALCNLLPHALPTTVSKVIRGRATYVATDGSLGKFFKRHGIDLVLVEQALEARAAGASA